MKTCFDMGFDTGRKVRCMACELGRYCTLWSDDDFERLRNKVVRDYLVENFSPGKKARKIMEEALELSRGLDCENRAYFMITAASIAAKIDDMLALDIIEEISEISENCPGKDSIFSSLARSIAAMFPSVALHFALKIEDSRERDAVLSEIIMKLAPRYGASALSLLRWMNDGSKFSMGEFSQIFEKVYGGESGDPRQFGWRGMSPEECRVEEIRNMAMEHVDEALRLARGLKDPYERARTLLSIARTADLDGDSLRRVVEEAFYSALESGGSLLLDAALEALRFAAEIGMDIGEMVEEVRRMVDSFDMGRDYSYCLLANFLVDYDTSAAEEILRLVKDKNSDECSYWYPKVVLRLVERITMHDVSRALEVAKMIEDERARETGIEGIVINFLYDGKIKNVEVALRLARTIGNGEERDDALGEIAEILAEEDVEGALRIVEEIENHGIKQFALKGIAEKIAPRDVEKAGEIFRRVTVPDYRAFILLAAAKGVEDAEQKKWLLEEAYHYAETSHEDHRKGILQGIASLMADIDEDEAWRIADEIDDYRRMQTKITILRTLAKRNLEKAVEWAKSFPEKGDRVKALLEIAKVIAEQETREIVEKIGDEEIRRMLEEGWSTGRIRSYLRSLSEDSPH